MVDVSSAKVTRLIVHKIGNKLREEGFTLSEHEVKRTTSLDDLLLKSYLAPTIKQGNRYDFYHESDLNLNVVHHFSCLIFQDQSRFVDCTRNIAKHLYSASTHPNIGGGEFIMILFDNIRLDGSLRQALAMFRIEGKSDYLDVKIKEDAVEVFERSGISLDKIQKGAVAISSSQNVYVIDSLGQKTKYWFDMFLKAVPSKTPQVCAKAAGSFVKAISTKVESPEAALEFSRRLSSTLETSETLTFAEIKKLSSSFLDESQIDEVLTGVSCKIGLDMPDSVDIYSKHLTKYARDVAKKTRISDGISLVISKQDVTIASMEVTNTEHGVRAVIDIEMKGE